MKKKYITILIIFSFIFSIEDNINAGPMVGYSEKVEVALWLQTKKEANVKFLYWDISNPNQIFETNKIITNKES